MTHDQLPFYAAGQLSGEQRAAFEVHLATCAECRAELDEWRMLADEVRQKASSRVKTLPPLNIFSNGHHKESDRMTTLVMNPPRPIRREVWITFAATLVLTLFGMLLTLRGSTGIPTTPVNQFADLQPITAENADQLTQLTQFGRGRIYDLTLSSDGKTLVVASAVGVYLHSIEDADLTGTRLIETNGVTNLAQSPDGSLLAVETGGKTTLWNPSTREMLRPLDIDGVPLHFSADGTKLLVEKCESLMLLYCLELTYGVFDLTTDTLTPITTVPGLPWRSATMNPAGTRVALVKGEAGSNPVIEVWDSPQFGGDTPTQVLELPQGAIHTDLRMNNDTLVGIISAGNSRLHIWNLETGDHGQRIMQGTNGKLVGLTDDTLFYYADNNNTTPDIFVAQSIKDTSFFKFGQLQASDRIYFPLIDYAAGRMALWGNGELIQVWDVSDADQPANIASIDLYAGSTNSLLFLDQNRVAFQSAGAPQVWDYTTGERLWRQSDTEPFYYDGPLAAVDGTLVYPEYLGSTSALRFWNGDGDALEESFPEWKDGHVSALTVVEGEVIAATFSRRDKKFTITRRGQDGTSSDKTFSSDGVRAEPYQNSGPALPGSFSADGRYLAVQACLMGEPYGCGQNWAIQIYDTVTGENVYTEDLNVEQDWFIKIAPHGSGFALSSCEQTLNRKIELAGGIAYGILYCKDRAISLYTIENAEVTKQWTQTLPGESMFHSAIASSPDSTLLAFASEKTLYLIDAATGEQLVSYPLTEYADSLAFNPEGTLLAVGAGGTVTLWGGSGFTQNQSVKLPEPITAENADQLTKRTQFGRGFIQGVAISPDGNTFAVSTVTGIYLHSGGSDRKISNTHTTDLLYSPDGSLLAAAQPESIALLDPETGAVQKEFDLANTTLFQFSDDGQKLLISQCSEFITCKEVNYGLLDLTTGDFDAVTTTSESFFPWAFPALSPDASKIAVIHPREDGFVAEIWEGEDTTVFETGALIRDPIMTDELLVASGTASSGMLSFLYIWDLKTGKLNNIRMEGENPQLMALSDDGQTAYYYATGDTADLFVAQSLVGDEKVITLLEDADQASGPRSAYTFNAGKLAVGGLDLIVWDVSTPENANIAERIDDYSNSASEVAFMPADRIALGSWNAPQVWNYKTGERLWRGAETDDYFSEPRLAVDPTGMLFYTAAQETVLRGWDEEPVDEPLAEWGSGDMLDIEHTDNELIAVAFSRQIPEFVVIRRAEDGTVSRTGFPAVEQKSTSIRGWLSEDGTRLFTTHCFQDDAAPCFDEDVWGLQVYDLETGDVLYRSELGASSQWNISLVTMKDGFALSHCTSSTTRRFEYQGGAYFRTECLARSLAVYDFPADGTPVERWSTQIDSEESWLNTISMGFSPDGSLLVYTVGEMLTVADAVTGKEIATIALGGSYYTDSLAFNPESTLLAVSSGGTVSLWGISD